MQPLLCVGMALQELLCLGGGDAIRSRWRRAVFGPEDNDRTRLGVAAFAVAAARSLNDGIERAKRTERDGEINVHTGFNKLGGDEATGLASSKPFADEFQRFLAMRRAEPSGEMETILHGQKAEDLASVCCRIDHAKGLRVV